MSNETKAEKKIKEIGENLKKHQSDLKEFDVDLIDKIRLMENGEEKAEFNDLRNKIFGAMHRKDTAALIELQKELKDRLTRL